MPLLFFVMDIVKIRKEIGFPEKKDWIKAKAKYTQDSLVIAGHPVMESWETDYMKVLADIISKKGGNILEVGYGLGIATNFIMKNGVGKHTVIEFHPDVIKKCKETYYNEIRKGDIKILQGFWEELVPTLKDESFDGILFDTYALEEEQMHKNHFWFFKEAFRLLKKGGVLSYYSDEAKNFSEEHIKKLKDAGFTKIDFKVCKVNPPKDCIYWDKKTMIAPIIVK